MSIMHMEIKVLLSPVRDLQRSAKNKIGYYRILLSSRGNQYYNIARVLALYKPY